MTDALLKPFYQIVTAPPRQWHPVIVHFPIAFLVLEAVLLSLWRVTGKPAHEPLAYACLHLSLWTMLIVAIAGVHDAGLDLRELLAVSRSDRSGGSRPGCDRLAANRPRARGLTGFDADERGYH